jgi:hypothetical protein
LRITNAGGAKYGVSWAASYLDAAIGDTATGNVKAFAPITDGSNGTPRIDDETRPINMTVKWIIRIK